MVQSSGFPHVLQDLLPQGGELEGDEEPVVGKVFVLLGVDQAGDKGLPVGDQEIDGGHVDGAIQGD